MTCARELALTLTLPSYKVSDVRTSMTCYLSRGSSESHMCFERLTQLLGRPHAAFEDVQVMSR